MGQKSLVNQSFAFRTHLKNRILVQDCGGAELPRFAGLLASS